MSGKPEICFVYPSEFGYQFSPSDVGHKVDILAHLTPNNEQYPESISIAPFVRATWKGRFPFLKQNKVLFMVGVQSRGLRNKVHRGSYSVWTSAMLLATRTSISRGEAEERLKMLFDEFVRAIEEENFCPTFRAAINEFLIAPAGRSLMDNTIKELPSKLSDPSVLSGVGHFPQWVRSS